MESRSSQLHGMVGKTALDLGTVVQRLNSVTDGKLVGILVLPGMLMTCTLTININSTQIQGAAAMRGVTKTHLLFVLEKGILRFLGYWHIIGLRSMHQTRGAVDCTSRHCQHPKVASSIVPDHLPATSVTCLRPSHTPQAREERNVK